MSRRAPLVAGGVLAASLTLAPVVAVVIAALVATTVVGATGAARPLVLGDPGALVRWGLPVVSVVRDLAAALTIGLLVLAAVALPVTTAVATAVDTTVDTAVDTRSGRTSASRGVRRAHPPALPAASAAAAVWAISTVAAAVMTYADVAGTVVTAPDFGAQLLAFVGRIDLGRGLLFTIVVAALVSTFAAGATTVTAAALLAGLALLGLIPPALGGHAAGASDHETAVTSLGLHLLGVTVWVGGVLALALLWRGLPSRAEPAVPEPAVPEPAVPEPAVPEPAVPEPAVPGPQVLAAQRFSHLAGWAFALVAVSGAINAWVRIGGVDGLATTYGALVLAKVGCLVLLGAAGWWHRRHSLAALAGGAGAAFARLVAVEVLVMGIAVGLAAALSRSAPPVAALPPADPSLAQSLTGYPMPPPPSPGRWLTLWQPDLLWLTLAGLGAAGYLVGVRRLRRRGDAWPVGRAVAWGCGLLVLTWATSGGPATYGRVLFSAHMLAHMTVSMAVPILLVAGAPVTLALRALGPRRDGTLGPREWLLALVESRALRVLTHPAVAPVVFAGSLIAFYYTGLFELALTTHVGHELMTVHFLVAGYLFMSVLMGVDPGPARPPYPLRMLLLLATMALHAFFGVALLAGRTVLAPDYFGGLGRTWGATLLADQQYGGGLAWGIGDLPTLLVALVIAVQWSRSDEREARRFDRAADRDGDADLAAYNAMLSRIATQDARQDARHDDARDTR